MSMNPQCVNCKCQRFVPAEGVYAGFHKCSECSFLVDLRHLKKVDNVILPDDPMDAMMCESCQ